MSLIKPLINKLIDIGINILVLYLTLVVLFYLSSIYKKVHRSYLNSKAGIIYELVGVRVSSVTVGKHGLLVPVNKEQDVCIYKHKGNYWIVVKDNN